MTNLNIIVKKCQKRLVPFMLLLYVLAFLDRSNIGFAKDSYQLDVHLSEEAYALGAGIFFVAYAFLGAPANLIMRKIGARKWIGFTTIIWGALSAAMAFADTESKFLTIRLLLGATEAGFFPGMIYLTALWFPKNHRASIMGLFYMGAPLALTLGSPLSGALLEMHGMLGLPGWFWMFMIEGVLAIAAGFFTFIYLSDSPEKATFLNNEEKQTLVRQLALEEEEKKENSKLINIIDNVKVWHLAIIYMTIQIAVYGLVFFLPTQVAHLLGTHVGFYASLIIAIPWITSLFGTYYIPRYSDKTGERKKIASYTFLIAGIGIGVSAISGPFIAIIALCFAAIGFIAVQPIFWTIPTQTLSGKALAAGIGFINMFGAFGGFLAPIIRVNADSFFSNQIAGLLTLSIIAIIGALSILFVKVDTKK